MTNTELHIDKIYHFDEHKRIAEEDLSIGARSALEMTDFRYKHDPIGYFQRVVDTVREPLSTVGAPYTVATEPGASKDTAVIIRAPFAQGVYPGERDPAKIAAVLKTLNDPNASEAAKKEAQGAFDSNSMSNPIRHLFLFDVMKHMGIRDNAGDVIPVICFGGASEDYDPKLNREQKRDQRKGKVRHEMFNALQILSNENVDKFYSVGYSEGANMAATLTAVSAKEYGDVLGAVIAEPTSYKQRSAGALVVNNMLNWPKPKGTPTNDTGIKSTEKWTEHGPQSRKDLEHVTNQFMKHQAGTIVKRGGASAALALRHDRLADDLGLAIYEHGVFPLTLAWNGTSALTHDIETTLFDPSNEQNHTVLERFRQAGKLRTAKAVGHAAVGAPHLAGESPMYYASLIADSIAWSQRVA